MIYKIWLLLLLLLFSSIHFAEGQSLKKAYHVAEESGDVVVKNETVINSEELDFSPSYLQNGIVFPSARQVAGKRDKNINTTFFELFYSDLDPNHHPYKARPFSLALNSSLHEGPVTFSNDGNKIFFTRNNSEKGLQKADKDGITRMKIYSAVRGEFDWENIQELNFNNNEYSCVHPSLNNETGRLYFSSNMPGGFGGYDLYYVDIDSSGWKTPVNLGSTVNSKKNELFPFYHTASRQLFFSSNGFEGKGGLDIYMISEVAYDSGPVINIGAPFNSAADDLGIIINARGTQGFFSSARKGGLGKDDIYSFESPSGIFGKTRPISIPMVVSTFDKSTGYHLAGSSIRVFEKKGDGYYHNGKSLFEAVLLPSADGENNLIFKSSRKGLNNLGAPDMVTDDSGDAKYKFLSQHEYTLLVNKEGYEVVEYPFSTLVFPKDTFLRISLDPKRCQTYNGYVLSNLSNGPIPDALVEIKSTLTNIKSLILTNQRGRFSVCLNDGESFDLTGYKQNFSPNKITLKGEASQGPKKATIMLDPSAPKVAKGTVIVLENIYYDFDKSNIRAGAARELEELAQLMRIYPSMEILLTAHTDVRGAEAYNLDLSIARAKNAKAFLVARGINSERMKVAGRGESQPRNHCQEGVKCNEVDHEYNRRTEVLITQLEEEVAIRYQLNSPK